MYSNSYGELVDRVSDIISFMNFGDDALKQWAANMCFEKAYRISKEEGKLVRTKHKKECAEEYKRMVRLSCAIGTQAHEHFESFIADKMNTERPIPNSDPYVEEFRDDEEFKAGVETAIKSYELFVSEHQGLKIFCTEQKLVSDIYGYGGTLDAAGEFVSEEYFDAPKILLDWKTSNSLNEKYNFQAAAYWNLLKENTGLDVDEAWIVRLDKKTVKYDKMVIPREKLVAYFDIFTDVVKIRNKIKDLGLLSKKEF
jgi:hypothetical protein